MLEVGNVVTQTKACGADWICSRSSVKPVRSCRKRAPMAWSESSRYAAVARKPEMGWPSFRLLYETFC